MLAFVPLLHLCLGFRRFISAMLQNMCDRSSVHVFMSPALPVRGSLRTHMFHHQARLSPIPTQLQMLPSSPPVNQLVLECKYPNRSKVPETKSRPGAPASCAVVRRSSFTLGRKQLPYSARQRSERCSRLFWESNLFQKYKSEISTAFILHSRNLEFVMFDWTLL